MPDDYIKRSDLLDFLQIIPIDLGYREIEDVKEYVRNAPAADVEPVRHGRWVPGKEISRTMLGDETLAVEYSDFRCSSCGRRYKEYVLIYRFCPNCGAKMDDELPKGEYDDN